MYKFLSAISLFLLSSLPVFGQQTGFGGFNIPRDASLVRQHDIEGEASKARAEAERLYRRVDQSAKRAIRSMCVECMGAQYNRPGSKTPLTLSEEISNMKVEPQLETEP